MSKNTDNMSVQNNDGTLEVQVGGDVGDLESNLSAAAVTGRDDVGTAQVVDGQARQLGPQKINTYRGSNGEDVAQSVQTPAGSPGSLQDAMKSPDKFTVEISGQRMTLEVAIKSGLVIQGADSIAEVKTPDAPEASKQTPPDFKPVASEKFASFIQKGRSLDPAFDQLLARCLSHAGDGSPSKQALVDLGDIMGQDPEAARNFTNAVTIDLSETVHNRLEEKYGKEGTDAWAFVLDNCDGAIKGTYLARLANGDPTAIDEIYQRGTSKTKY